MTYELNTPGNLAVQSLVSGGRCRVTVSGEAPVKLGPGTYKLSVNIGTKAARIAGMFKVYDSGDTGDYCEVRCRLDNTSIVDEGGSITATNMEAAVRGDVSSFEWQAVLTEAVGEWILEVRTDGESKQTPLDFSGFSIVEVQEGEEWALGVDTNDLVEGAVTEPILAAGAVTPEKIADPDVFFTGRERWAPRFSRVTSFGSFTWAPSTTSVGLRCRFAVTQLPRSGSYDILARSVTGYLAIRLTSGGVIEAKTGTTSTPLGTITANGAHHYLTVDLVNTALTATLDGVATTATTVDTILTTPAVQYIGKATAVPPESYAEFTLWDVEFIDTADTNKSVFWRMDEQSGAFRNAYTKLGDALYNASNTSGVTIATMGTVTQPERILVHSVDGGDRPIALADIRRTRNRVVAYGGKGSGTFGAFASFSWGPTSTFDFELSGVFSSRTGPGATAQLLGALAAQYPNVDIQTSGIVRARHGTSVVAQTGAGAFPFDGLPHIVRVKYGVSGADVTAAIFIDGVQAVTGTLAASSWLATPTTVFVGASSVGASNSWPGTIHDVYFKDNITPNNDVFLNMDEASGAYLNRCQVVGDPLYNASNTAAASATRNGFVSKSTVPTTDGRGRAWQIQDGSPILTAAHSAAAQTGVTGAANITLGTELLDPMSAFTASAFTAPVAGIVDCTITGTLAETAAAASVVTLGVAKATTIQGAAPAVRVPVITAGVPFAHRVVFPVAAADVVRGYISGITGGGTISIESANLSIVFTPDPTAG